MDCWAVTPEHGFLMAIDPVVDPLPLLDESQRSAVAALLDVAAALPELMDEGRLRDRVAQLQPVEAGALGDGLEVPVLERLHQVYAYLANAYLWMPGADPGQRLPEVLAVPFVALSDRLGRPPVLSYTNSQLVNWVRRDADAAVSLENIRAIQVFQRLPDEEWFWITHSAIEAAGGPAVLAGAAALAAVGRDHAEALEEALSVIVEGLEAILGLAKRIEEGCDPNVFFRTLRPFLFSPPDGIIFEGVARYGGRPQAFLGQTGAQSSLIPAICAAIGLQHRRSDLTDYLEAVRAYMPEPHRAFVDRLDGAQVRDFVLANRERSGLRDRYNACVEGVVAFRRFHLGLASTYIASKVAEPLGTGGTDFMRWLTHMTRETREQLI